MWQLDIELGQQQVHNLFVIRGVNCSPCVYANSLKNERSLQRGPIVVKEKVELAAIVEVDKDSRVQCQEPGCGKPLFKKIHVIRVEDKLSVIGATCFNRLYVDDRNEGDEPRVILP